MSGLKDLKTLCFIKRTKLLKNGEAPIFIRVTVGLERGEFGVKKSVHPKCWDETKQRVRSSCSGASEINTLLSNQEQRIRTIAEYIVFEEKQITPQAIITKIQGKKEKRRTILEIFRDHNDKVKQLSGIDFSAATAQRYETSYMHTQNFIRWKYNKDDYPLDLINQQFINDYELYLKTKRKCNHNSSTKYLKNFKKIIRIALANNWIEHDPFASIKFKLTPVDAIYLDDDELNALIKKEFRCERLTQVRDIFLFCCFTGLAFADAKDLKREHLSKDKDGYWWIHKKRKKTNQMSTIFVIDAALRIIDKYKNHPVVLEKDVLLPVPTNQKMNSYLKEVADFSGIDKPISTHSARHTFATTVALSNNIPIEVVSKTLGHSNVKMTQRYARTTENLIKNNMEKIASIY